MVGSIYVGFDFEIHNSNSGDLMTVTRLCSPCTKSNITEMYQAGNASARIPYTSAAKPGASGFLSDCTSARVRINLYVYIYLLPQVHSHLLLAADVIPPNRTMVHLNPAKFTHTCRNRCT